MGRDRAGRGGWLQRKRAAAIGHGRGCRRFRRGRLQDLFVANVDQEMFSLYQNNRNETFSDVAHKNGIAQSTRLLSGWGLKFFDYDNDGAVDLILANGHPDDMIDSYSQQVKYKEPLLLFHQESGKAAKRKRRSRSGIHASHFAARGLAIGDYNNDGRLDVLIGNNGGGSGVACGTTQARRITG